MSSDSVRLTLPGPERLHRVVFWICATFSLGGIVAVTLLLSVSERHLKSLIDQPNDNATWVVAQVEIELYRLRKSLTELAAGRTSLGTAQLRLDILVSRILLLDSPIIAEFHPATVTDPIQDRLMSIVEKVQNQLQSYERSGAVLDPALAAIDAAENDVHHFVIQTTLGVAKGRSAQAAALAAAETNMRSTMAVVLALLVFLVVWLLWQRKVLQSLVTQLQASTQQLKHAADQAKAANAAKSHFLASMSHELRTPLNAIIGFSDLMRQEPWGSLGNSRYKGYTRDILQAGRHLLSLVSDILDLSKIESGRFQLFDENVDLNEEVALASAFVQTAAFKAQVAIDIHIASDLPPLQADSRRLRQVFVNLISNAVRFSPPDSTVTVKAEQTTDGAIVISVNDTGAGMTADQLTEAFIPFAQVTSDAHKARDGTGLGLPLSKYLVEAHGGVLTLNSRPGLGTSAIVSLPPWRVLAITVARDTSADPEATVGREEKTAARAN